MVNQFGQSNRDYGREISDIQRAVNNLDRPALPVGSIILYAGEQVPNGWLLCDGSLVESLRYPALFRAISTQFGSGENAETFKVPSLPQLASGVRYIIRS